MKEQSDKRPLCFGKYNRNKKGCRHCGWMEDCIELKHVNKATYSDKFIDGYGNKVKQAREENIYSRLP